MMLSDLDINVIENGFKAIYATLAKSDLAIYSKLLSGIFALAYLGNIFLNSWARGKELYIIDLMKPFVVLFFIMNFSLVTETLNGLIYEPLCKGTALMVNLNQKDIDNVLASLCAHENTSSQNESISILGADLETIKMEGRRFVYDIMLTCAQLFCIIAKICMYAYSHLLRVVLTLLGPVAFAFSLLPYFSGNIKSWLTKYISTMLYVPICNLIMYISQTFLIIHGNMQLELTEDKRGVLSIEGLTLVVILVISALAYFSVPTIAGYIVSGAESTGGRGIAAAAGNGAMLLGKGSGKAFAGALGMAAYTHGQSVSDGAGQGGFMGAVGSIYKQYKENKKSSESSDGNSGVKGDG